MKNSPRHHENLKGDNLSDFKLEAHRVGANAVVAVDLDYTQLGDTGWCMVLLVAIGTAVTI